MKLRWFVVCDKDGRKTNPELQYWDEGYQMWDGIPYVECKDYEEAQYMSNEEVEHD